MIILNLLFIHFSSMGNERILSEVSSVVTSGLGVVVGGSVGR